MHSEGCAGSDGRLEMGDAGVFVQKDPGCVCGAQKPHRVLSNAVGGDSVCERAVKIPYRERIDSVSTGEALAAAADSQDHGVSGAREPRARPEVENLGNRVSNG